MLEFQNVSVTLGGQCILNDISFTVPKNQLTMIIGLNGAGKSTLVNCVGKQNKYTGSIYLQCKNIQDIALRQLAQMIAILPQTLPLPNVTVNELASFGRNPYHSFQHKLTSQDQSAIVQALDAVGVSTLQSRDLRSLSGGERQKAFLAMILAQQTDIIILDEPTTYMDASTETEFLALLKRFTAQGKTLMMIMHNLSQAVKYADNIVIIHDHTCVFTGTKEECLQTKQIEKFFGVRRYEASDSIHPQTKEIFFA